MYKKGFVDKSSNELKNTAETSRRSIISFNLKAIAIHRMRNK